MSDKGADPRTSAELEALRADAISAALRLETEAEEFSRLRSELADTKAKLAALREHTLANNPDFKTLHDLGIAYLDAVEALQEVRGAPLSTTLGWLIRQGYLVPADPGVDPVDAPAPKDAE